VGAAVNWSISVGLTTWFDLFAARPLLAAAVGIVVGSGFNFVLCDNAVFQRTARAEPALGRR
jgi:putative flippase GtrA